VRALALALVALTLAGCSRTAAQDEARPLVVVLFDVSKSTQDPSIRDAYRAAFERVVDAVAADHGTLVGDVIDDNPLAHSSYPIDATFPACDPLTDNRLECDARDAQVRDHVMASASSILDGTAVQAGTDIHDGVRLAERVFAAYPQATSRSLVVLSDMVERSRELSVGRVASDDSVASTLDAFAADGAIPNLADVDVYVVGAGVVSSSSALPAERILAIQRFWQAYFTAAGAELPPERYGAALVRFP
jgi:hypothetical protein